MSKLAKLHQRHSPCTTFLFHRVLKNRGLQRSQFLIKDLVSVCTMRNSLFCICAWIPYTRHLPMDRYIMLMGIIEKYPEGNTMECAVADNLNRILNLNS